MKSLQHLIIKNHPVLNDVSFDFVNPKTNKPYAVVAFVGENGCGKTTLLNEIFNLNESEYIQNKKEILDDLSRPFNALYLRQGSVHKNAMKEVGKLIDGKDMYPTESKATEAGLNQFGIKSDNVVNNIDKGLPILQQLGDDEITAIYKDNDLSDVYCSQEVSRKIDGKEHGYNISNYSSGQQEILLKLKDLKNMTSGTDCVLLDEPETSLHPRWQKEIVNIIESMVEENGYVPQIFLATHSEKVLESLLTRDDVLIVRLSKVDGVIKSESINEMDLRLPVPTFSELDYVVFHIPSLEYHDELFNRFAYLVNKNSTIAVDEKLQKIANKIYKESAALYEKTREFKVHGMTYSTKMLPTYIRDYFHHPNEIKNPTDEEISKSIGMMRRILNFLKDKEIKN